MIPGVTIESVRDLPFQDLIERIEVVLGQFDPGDVESEQQRIQRINRTLDELPQIYRWLLQLSAWCNHWTQTLTKDFGQRDKNVQALRQRKELLADMASAAKLRYEATSRSVTTIMEFDPTGMPRSR